MWLTDHVGLHGHWWESHLAPLLIHVGPVLLVLVGVDDTARVCVRVEVVLMLLRAKIRVVLARGSGDIRVLQLVVVGQLMLLLLWIECHLTSLASTFHLLGMRGDKRFFLLPVLEALIIGSVLITSRC